VNHRTERQRDPQLYIRVLENLDRAVIAIDAQGVIQLFNPAAELNTGYSERQILGRRYDDIFTFDNEFTYLIQAALENGRSISTQEHVMLRRPIGKPLPVTISVAPIFVEQGKIDGAVLIIRDMSPVVKLEEAVRRADRMTMLGTMSAGLAHEIRNPLGGIKGAAQLMAMELPEDSPLNEYIEVMIREVDRVDGIIEELMNLSRPRSAENSAVNLSKVLNDIVLLQKEAHRDKNIQFILNLDPSIPELIGDERLLTRLFLNLIKNAAEAIEDTGAVTISTRMTSEYQTRSEADRPASLIHIEIKDNGTGIPPETMKRLFTPFFTTRKSGNGLGLVMCQKIITEHDGFIKVDSDPAGGTSFSVYLPLRR